MPAPTDPSSVTDVRVLISLRDDCLAEIELARETISSTEKKLTVITTQLQKIADEARTLLATINPPVPSYSTRKSFHSDTYNHLRDFIQTLSPPPSSYPFSHFTSTFPTVPQSTLSQILNRLVQSGTLQRTPGHNRGQFQRGPLSL